ncbi:hypothetical protein IV203_037209 [Nitzschia inconspicua]|uniref:Uncharacterized protein n=1 Tax=Nitzschia inconspicua TaxID=303405 RepID=A0A9K3LL23_9STRA|nr:hypothetical protein IV203_037209 [Nitzschia inconspicua]
MQSADHGEDGSDDDSSEDGFQDNETRKGDCLNDYNVDGFPIPVQNAGDLGTVVDDGNENESGNEDQAKVDCFGKVYRHSSPTSWIAKVFLHRYRDSE